MLNSRAAHRTNHRPLSRSLRVKLTQGVLLMVCLAGAMYQINEIAQSYFKYATSSVVELKIPSRYEIDALTFCTRYIDVLDFAAIRADNPKRDWHLNLSAYWIRHYQDALTIGEVMKYTPSEQYFVEHAEFRRQATFKLFECASSNCSKFFTVRRFIYLEYVCYTLHAHFKNETLSYGALTVTPAAAGQIFHITLSSKFNDSHLIKIVSHEPNALPYISLQNVAQKQREFDEKNHAANFNKLTASAVKLNVKRLPPPYDTMCQDYTERGYPRRYEAIQDCVKKKVLHHFKKMPFSLIVHEPINLSVISYLDIVNATVTSDLFKFHAQCVQLNPREDCSSEISFTTTDTYVGERISLMLITATSPFTNITVVKQTSFVELVSVVMSTASTWTGFAVISLNPVFLFPRMRGRLRTLFLFVTGNTSSHPESATVHVTPRGSVERDRIIEHLENQRKIFHLIQTIECRLERLEIKVAEYLNMDLIT